MIDFRPDGMDEGKKEGEKRDEDEKKSKRMESNKKYTWTRIRGLTRKLFRSSRFRFSASCLPLAFSAIAPIVRLIRTAITISLVVGSLCPPCSESVIDHRRHGVCLFTLEDTVHRWIQEL